MAENPQFPKFVSNSPCGYDLFEGQAQNKIAENVSRIIKYEVDCNIIGIDGGWGSGKSNLVKQIEKKISGDGYHFFIYDAWGHQEDLQRRSFLEELTEDLITKKLVDESWNDKLKKLLAKVKETESKKTPKLSIGVIVTVLAILVTPVFKSLSEKVGADWKLTVLSIPLFAVAAVFLAYFISEKTGSVAAKIKQSFNRLFLEYQNKLEEETKYETISEDEPSVRKFRNWMSEISQYIGSQKLILVFDNMDRLPQKKVQELWSSIHVFFCEHFYSNIKVIVPFDREHIKLAFKSEDGENKQYGDDFINKTFSVVYRVSPPILSDWKNYFVSQWKEAFGEEELLNNSKNILQIFDMLSEEITPRKIIAFINEIVSIKMTFKELVPNNYIALFILGKHAIVKKPIDEIIHPTYLKGLSYLYETDEDLPKFIASLFYQVEPEKAIQIVFTDQIKRTLNENDASNLEKISDIPEFYDILENSIADISNYENAILALHNLPEEKFGGAIKADIIWNSLFRKIVPRNKSDISEFQVNLLSRISNKQEYLKQLLVQLTSDPDFSSNSYYDSIETINSKFKDSLDVFAELPMKQVQPEDFIGFVEKAKSDYKIYNLRTDEKELNNLLSSLEIIKLKDVLVIPFLKDSYSFQNFIKKLEKDIESQAPNNDKVTMHILYQRYKDAVSSKPLQKFLEDSQIYSMFTSSKPTEEFYYDLIAMRLRRLDNFEAGYEGVFVSILQSSEMELVTKIAERIEYYITYGDLLLGSKNMSDSMLYKSVVKSITSNPVGTSSASIRKLIDSFQQITTDLDLEPSLLLQRLEKWQTFFKEDVDSTNIKDNTSPFFFKNAVLENLELTNYAINKLEEFFDSLSEEEWQTSLSDLTSYEIECSLIINYKYSLNAVQALKELLKDIALNKVGICNKQIIQSIFDKLEEQGKSLKATFNSIRDAICREDSMSIDLFKFFADWLFKYADLEGNPSSLRTIFILDVMRNEDCFNLVKLYQHQMPKIINAANEEAKDFFEVVKEILVSNPSDSNRQFADQIGIVSENDDN